MSNQQPPAEPAEATTTDTAPAADADHLIEQLTDGDRNLLSDANAINAPDGLQAVEMAHEAANDERVVLHYNFYTAYRATGEGSMDEIDIFTTGQ